MDAYSLGLLLLAPLLPIWLYIDWRLEKCKLCERELGIPIKERVRWVYSGLTTLSIFLLPYSSYLVKTYEEFGRDVLLATFPTAVGFGSLSTFLFFALILSLKFLNQTGNVGIWRRIQPLIEKHSVHFSAISVFLMGMFSLIEKYNLMISFSSTTLALVIYSLTTDNMNTFKYTLEMCYFMNLFLLPIYGSLIYGYLINEFT